MEINLTKSKFLLIGAYHSTHEVHGTSDDVFLRNMSNVIDRYSSSYEKCRRATSNFLGEFQAKNLVKEPTCYKNQSNPSCVDLLITNGPRSFMKTTTVSTGLSDFHKMVVTVMRSTFTKAEPITVKYRDFSRYNKILFGNDLKRNLVNQPNDYDTFERIFLASLAPQKTKL